MRNFLLIFFLRFAQEKNKPKIRSHLGPVPQVSGKLCEAKPEAKSPWSDLQTPDSRFYLTVLEGTEPSKNREKNMFLNMSGVMRNILVWVLGNLDVKNLIVKKFYTLKNVITTSGPCNSIIPQIGKRFYILRYLKISYSPLAFYCKKFEKKFGILWVFGLSAFCGFGILWGCRYEHN